MHAHHTEHDVPANDLGPLAWVLDELRKSLDASGAALRRFLREAAQATATEADAEAEPVDPVQLRMARQHLHQALGALEMVGLAGPAQVLRGMEAAVQALLDKPAACDEAAVGKLERAGHALVEFLDGLLLGKRQSAVALFPQYREVLALGRAERVHPADLWSLEWQWREPQQPHPGGSLPYAPAVRARMDQAVLRIVKSGEPAAARELSRIAAGLSAGAVPQRARVFWQVCAGFFEALALQLLPADVYVKRAASRVLVQYAQLAKAGDAVSERLAQDLVFFCAQAVPPAPADAPLLQAVRQAWGLADAAAIDYESLQFGRFEPALLAQVRKRIGAAKEVWSQLAGGDDTRLRSCADHFRQLGEALIRLHAATAPLADALQAAGEAVTRTGRLPRAELAMEVATAILYLEAAFQDLDLDEARLDARARRLAERLEHAAREGGDAGPLEGWMEELYRRVSDRQTLGSVVGELRLSLGELEKDLDNFFRNPQELAALQAAPTRLAQMRGVFSVLGLDEAAQAVLRMREAVDGVVADRAAGVETPLRERFDKLGANLGALGFLIDMLNYQPALAKKLFVYDEAAGELRPLMGRAGAARDGLASFEPQVLVPPAGRVAPADEPAPAPSAALDTDAGAAAPWPVIPQAAQPVPSSHAPADAGAASLPTVAAWNPLPDLPTLPASAAERDLPTERAFQAPDLPTVPAFGARDPQTVRADQVPDLPTMPALDLGLDFSSFATPVPPAAAVPAAADAGPDIDTDSISGVLREAIPDTLVVPAADATVPWPGDELALESSPAPAAPLAWPTDAAPVPEGDPLDELLAIFIDEAREVVHNGRAALDALAANPADLNELTTLRRAFHTLKGSSRMVGLDAFGEAGWALEQVFNAWLADQKSASPDLLGLAGEAIDGFGRWTEDIAMRRDAAWHPDLFRLPAEAFRLRGERLPLRFPAQGDALPALPALDTVDALDPPAPLEGSDVVDVVDLVDVPELAHDPSAAPEEAAVEVPAAEAADVADAAEPAVTDGLETVESIEVSGEEWASLFGEAAGQPEVAAESAAAAEPAEVLEVVEVAKVVEAIEVAEVVDAVEAAERVEAIELVEPIDVVQVAAAVHAVDAVEAFEPVEPSAVTDVTDITDAIDLAGVAEPKTELEVEAVPEARPHLKLVLEPELEPEDPTPIDEQTRVIDGLRISIPLYNVYLNEADEWSRRLQTELSEWALEYMEPLPESTVALAHSLAGSSATVGFDALSRIARTLEHALARTHLLAWGTPQHAQAYSAAAEEIRRLLHQFAAGFLKEANPRVIEDLTVLDDLHPPVEATTDAAPLAGTGAMVHDAIEEQVPATQVQAAEVSGAAGTPAFQPHAVVHVPVHAEPRVVASLDDQREGIDLVDAIDADLFPIFDEEASELLPQLGGALRQWSARPDNRSARDAVLRSLHTLKGSARLAGALRLGEMAHRMESLVEQIGAEGLTEADIEPLLQRFDALQSTYEQLRTAAQQPESVGSAEPAEPPLEAAAHGDTSSEASDGQAVAAASPLVPAKPGTALAPPVSTSVGAQRATASQGVRVRSQLLDRLMNQAGEVMITRSRLEDELRQLRGSLHELTGNLDRLRSQLRDIELQAETQMQSRLAQTKDSAGFDPLEFDRFTRVQELTRMMAESVNDVATVQRNLQRTVEATEDDLAAQARQTRELQRDLLRTRMVEFEAIADRLYRVVRQATKDTGRPVRLDIEGGSIELDRGVLDRMTPAFEHLLRNCVAHGIEDPAVREASGKPATGQIRIVLGHEGNDVSVEFRDDGAGLDLARIREKAIALGLVPPGTVMADNEAADLIFTAGFSTASRVTELSGRGIGMDVVRSEVNALGGRIETSTEAGRGTSFRLVLPLTTAVTQVVMIRSGHLSIGVPANLVEVVRRATGRELQQAYNSGAYTHDGEQVPFFWSGALLQSSRRSDEPQARTLPVVVFRSASQRVAVHVDEVLGSREVVVKNLGPQLSRLPGLAGMSVLPSGAVVLIYNPVALAHVYGEQARALSADQAQPEMLEQAGTRLPTLQGAEAVPAVPLVLVVDDSITVRRVTQRLLQREGWRVALAADGLQALERLAEETPAVVLSDIEMPRMDGFDLVRNLRGDERWAGLPVVMITSRIAEKHREHARQLGVNHYLGKPYSEEELLGLVRRYCSVEAGADLAADSGANSNAG